VQPTPALIAQMEEEDSLGWTRINSHVVNWAAELRAAGYATAILSNMPSDKLTFMRKNPAFDWIRDFLVAIFSCDHRMVKPEQSIYRMCLDLLGKDPAECVFLDDSSVNVEGARAVGIAALLFQSPEQAAPILSSTWGLPVRSLVSDFQP
jgi:HAD superfamily hydrolase (TIGR01509 family)